MKIDSQNPNKKEFVNGKMMVSEYQQEVPDSFLGKLTVLISTTWGKFIFFYLKIRYRAAIIAFKPLANHLESQIFPELRQKRIKWLTLNPLLANGSNPVVHGYHDEKEIEFPKTGRFYSILEKYEIKRIKLDTYLESNQLIETLLMLLWVMPVIRSCRLKKAGFWTWDRRAIAGGMLTSAGFHRFCADLKFDLESRTYQVDYTYCELFMAKLVKSYAGSFSTFRDHRAYFSLAPMAALIAFLVFSLPLILIFTGFDVWSILLLPAIILPPITVWMTMHILGAMQYDMEHRDHLLSEYVRQEKVLARFPEVNPNPIYKISNKGEIIYVNPAASKQISNLTNPSADVGSILPQNYLELTDRSLKEKEPLDVEITAQDKVYRYLVSPFFEDRTVLFAGSDITYLRKIENELRDINTNLENLVRLRTKELELTQEATIICLASLAEVRDPETGEHIERTRLYVKALAIHLRSHPRFRETLDNKTIELLYNSAPLHDIGKVGIPDAILLKPGRHTDEEFAFMKKHTNLGAEALQAAIKKLGFDSFLNLALEIAEGHHERWDGSGYPRGLKGNDIPVSARLMALADVYDALISKRVYKPAFPHEKARDLIISEKGNHFDPDVVEAFMAIENEFIEIAAQYPDQE